MPIREEAINVFMGLPGDGDRLELTYNHGVDSYELGTGYNHIALTVDDLDGTLERARRQGHRAREAAVPGPRGRLAHLLRARSGRLSHRADRAEPGLSEAWPPLRSQKPGGTSRSRWPPVGPAARAGRASRRGRREQTLRLRQRDRRVRRRVAHLVERGVVEVADVVAAEVVARVVRLPGRAAVDRGLLCRLDPLGAGEQAARRDAGVDERPVVRSAVERRRLRREPLAREVVEEEPLDLGRRLQAPRPRAARSPTGRRRRRSARSSASRPCRSSASPRSCRARTAAGCRRRPPSPSRPCSSAPNQMKRTLLRGFTLRICSAISRIVAEPEPLSLMPGPTPTLSRCAPTTMTLSGSPSRVSAITFDVG